MVRGFGVGEGLGDGVGVGPGLGEAVTSPGSAELGDVDSGPPGGDGDASTSFSGEADGSFGRTGGDAAGAGDDAGEGVTEGEG